MADQFVINVISGKASIIKDPDATLDYIFNWTSWLESIGDVILTATVTVTDSTSGCSILVSNVIDSGRRVVTWVQGGIIGKRTGLRCRILTAGGRTEDRTVYLKIKDR